VLTEETRDAVEALQRQLFDAQMALDVHGATEPAGALQQVRTDGWGLISLARMQMAAVNQESHSEDRVHESYMAAWAQMHTHLYESQLAWEQWQSDHEAVTGGRVWLRRVRGWRVWPKVRRWRVWRWFQGTRTEVVGDGESGTSGVASAQRDD